MAQEGRIMGVDSREIRYVSEGTRGEFGYKIVRKEENYGKDEKI